MIFQKSACIETLYTELPFLERFHAAKADGFDFVEFWSWTDKNLAAVRAAADAAAVYPAQGHAAENDHRNRGVAR